MLSENLLFFFGILFVVNGVAVVLFFRGIRRQREAEEHYRRIIETANDAFIAMDSDGMITDWNRQAEAIFGWRREEAVGVALADRIIPEPLRERHRRGLRRFLETGEGPVLNKQIEISALHREGHTFPVELTIWPISSKGRPLFNAFIRDVTQRKKAEAEIRQKTGALARSNQELEQFAYIASHDLQEPLRMISSFTGLLAERYRGKLGAEADEFIHFVTDGARRMQRMIQDLLEYSRVGRKEIVFESVDTEALLQQVLQNLKIAMEEGGACVTHDPLPPVKGDALQLMGLFQNLIGNAIKFCGKEKPVIHVSAAAGEREATFSVRDNGIGIDPQFYDRIFVLFQRLHGRGEYGGTGIGLAICKKIVERHGGKIWVESAPGKGSTFYLTLPVIPPAS